MQYIALIEALPEDELRLGEILVRCGTLSREALAQRAQRSRRSAAPTRSTPLGEILVQQASGASRRWSNAGLERQQQARERKAAREPDRARRCAASSTS